MNADQLIIELQKLTPEQRRSLEIVCIYTEYESLQDSIGHQIEIDIGSVRVEKVGSLAGGHKKQNDPIKIVLGY